MKTNNISTKENQAILFNLLTTLKLDSTNKFKKSKQKIEEYIKTNEISLSYSSLLRLYKDNQIELFNKDYDSEKQRFFNLTNLLNIVFAELAKSDLYSQLANKLKSNNIDVHKFVQLYYSKVDDKGNILTTKNYIYKILDSKDNDINSYFVASKYELFDTEEKHAHKRTVAILEECFNRFAKVYKHRILNDSEKDFNTNIYSVGTVARTYSLKIDDGIYTEKSTIILDTKIHSLIGRYDRDNKNALLERIKTK